MDRGYQITPYTILVIHVTSFQNKATVRKSGPIRTAAQIFSRIRPWGKKQCTKFHQNFSKIAACELNTNLQGQPSDGQAGS